MKLTDAKNIYEQIQNKAQNPRFEKKVEINTTQTVNELNEPIINNKYAQFTLG